MREQQTSSPLAKKGFLAWVCTTAFIVFIVTAVLNGRLPAIVLALYCGMSITAFIAYAIDKSAARNGQWRTKENTLHLLALVGGWPGALVAQRLFRHKSRKQSFQAVFWITVTVNCGALAWLLKPQGDYLLGFIQ